MSRAAWLLAAALLPGCGGRTLREPAFGPHPDGSKWDGELLDTPPPPVQAEQIGDAPSPAHVWIDGQWTFLPLTKRWTWEQGAFCVPPAGATHYARPVLERYRLVLGRTTRWNEALQRYEEVDSGDDRFRYRKGRFYGRAPDGSMAPIGTKPVCQTR